MNVVGASTNKPITPAYYAYEKVATALQPTTLTFTAPARAKVNEWFDISGSLTAGGKGVGGALIHVQASSQGNWDTFGNLTTNSDGNFAGQIQRSEAGDRIYRVTYDGDSQYEPSVSNEVVVTVS